MTRTKHTLLSIGAAVIDTPAHFGRVPCDDCEAWDVLYDSSQESGLMYTSYCRQERLT